MSTAFSRPAAALGDTDSVRTLEFRRRRRVSGEGAHFLLKQTTNPGERGRRIKAQARLLGGTLLEHGGTQRKKTN